MEGGAGCFQDGVWDEHLSKCLGEDDVDATASVHEHARHIRVADLSFENQDYVAWPRDGWRVILSQERDVCFCLWR